ncbi:MAG: hypothetical protein J6W87_00615, partial [Clostridia bacterium]|nr:hypothetical protein [Clostridia bacterium]
MNKTLIRNNLTTKTKKDLIVRKNGAFANAGKRIKKSRYLILMIIPAIIYYAVFCYVPMYGVLIAFKRFLPSRGIMG